MTTMEIGRATQVAPAGRSFGLLTWMARLWRRMARRRRERQTLIELARMDAYMLRDIGIEPRHISDALAGRNGAALFDPTRKE